MFICIISRNGATGVIPVNKTSTKKLIYIFAVPVIILKFCLFLYLVCESEKGD